MSVDSINESSISHRFIGSVIGPSECPNWTNSHLYTNETSIPLNLTVSMGGPSRFSNWMLTAGSLVEFLLAYIAEQRNLHCCIAGKLLNCVPSIIRHSWNLQSVSKCCMWYIVRSLLSLQCSPVTLRVRYMSSVPFCGFITENVICQNWCPPADMLTERASHSRSWCTRCDIVSEVTVLGVGHTLVVPTCSETNENRPKTEVWRLLRNSCFYRIYSILIMHTTR